MCEFLERARLRDTPTEEVREWSTMTHRVVELCGPFPTPDDMRVELWLHEESATSLLDMCDQIDAEFDRTKAENAKLRELLKNALTYIEYEGCGVECPEAGNSATLTSCDYCNRYETESCACVIEHCAHELGIEV